MPPPFLNQAHAVHHLHLGGGTFQKELHHPRVDHVVGEPFVPALHPEGSAEFLGLEVDIVESDTSHQLVAQVFFLYLEVGHAAEREVEQSVAGSVGPPVLSMARHVLEVPHTCPNGVVPQGHDAVQGVRSLLGTPFSKEGMSVAAVERSVGPGLEIEPEPLGHRL